MFETELMLPILNTFSYAFVGVIPNVAGISSLGGAIGPYAISGFVTLIVVGAFNREFGRAFPHVGKKVFVGIPSFANSDAPVPIIGVSLIIWVVASLTHGFPNAIRKASVLSMLGYHVMKRFARSASAALRVSASQPIGKNDGFVSAITTALSRHTSTVRGVPNNRQAVELLANTDRVSFSHVRSFLERMWSGPMQVLQHLYGSLYFTLKYFFLKGNSMKGVT